MASPRTDFAPGAWAARSYGSPRVASFLGDNFEVEEISAYHEAGHALVAISVGARVRSVTIDPQWDDGPRRHADIEVEWSLDRPADSKQREKFVLVALAGPVAEMLHTGEPYHPGQVAEWADDWRLAWQAASGLYPDERSRLGYLERVTADLHRWLSRDDRWAALAAVVDELVAHETLEGDQVEAIVSQWLE